jgi:hypothetical protein
MYTNGIRSGSQPRLMWPLHPSPPIVAVNMQNPKKRLGLSFLDDEGLNPTSDRGDGDGAKVAGVETTGAVAGNDPHLADCDLVVAVGIGMKLLSERVFGIGHGVVKDGAIDRNTDGRGGDKVSWPSRNRLEERLLAVGAVGEVTSSIIGVIGESKPLLIRTKKDVVAALLRSRDAGFFIQPTRSRWSEIEHDTSEATDKGKRNRARPKKNGISR